MYYIYVIYRLPTNNFRAMFSISGAATPKREAQQRVREFSKAKAPGAAVLPFCLLLLVVSFVLLLRPLDGTFLVNAPAANHFGLIG